MLMVPWHSLGREASFTVLLPGELLCWPGCLWSNYCKLFVRYMEPLLCLAFHRHASCIGNFAEISDLVLAKVGLGFEMN